MHVAMVKQKRNSKSKTVRADAQQPPGDSPAEEQIAYSNLALHELFAQQTRAMLDRTDLDEEQKVNLLVAMSCPCCGAGGLSFTAKLKRRT